MYEGEMVGFEPEAATKGQFRWLCCLILSFCYELPLVTLTEMDRMNPRLYDMVFLIGFFTILPSLERSTPLPRLYRIWAWLVALCAICAIIWCPWFPFYYGKYSIFYALRYIQGLITLYMVVRIPLSPHQKRILYYMIIIGGFIVAAYAVPEYLRPGSRKRVDREGDVTIIKEGTLVSCLGGGYLHAGMFSCLSCLMGLSLLSLIKNDIAKIFWFILCLFIGWPAFFSGARASVFACIIGLIVLFFVGKASFKVTLIVSLVGVMFWVVLLFPKVFSTEYLSKSRTFQRFQESEKKGSGASFTSRLSLDFYDIQSYRWQGWRIPFVGAGFYVAPQLMEDGRLRFRPGYGIHNIYLFAIEQGGIGVFILFIAYLLEARRQLKYIRKMENSEIDSAFANGMYAVLIGMVIVGWAGQVFWQGFGSVNFNTYLIVLFQIASRTTETPWSDQGYYLNSNDETVPYCANYNYQYV